MASFNFVFMFLVLFVTAQFASANPRMRRDIPAEKPKDALTNIQTFFRDNLQLDNLIGNIKEFGGKVQTGATDLGEKILSGTKQFVSTIQEKADITLKPASTT